MCKIFLDFGEKKDGLDVAKEVAIVRTLITDFNTREDVLKAQIEIHTKAAKIAVQRHNMHGARLEIRSKHACMRYLNQTTEQRNLLSNTILQLQQAVSMVAVAKGVQSASELTKRVLDSMPLKTIEEVMRRVQENEITLEDGAAALGETIGTVDDGEVDAEMQKLLDEQAEEAGDIAEADAPNEEPDMGAYM
jgi:tryptophan synthase alpha subunit